MYLQVKVIPKSPRTEFVERMGDETLKFRLKAAPERGKANEELIKFIAKATGVQRSKVSIISGHTDTRKLLKLPDDTQIPW